MCCEAVSRACVSRVCCKVVLQNCVASVCCERSLRAFLARRARRNAHPRRLGLDPLGHARRVPVRVAKRRRAQILVQR
eukprot:6140515-Pleurochrysis_carterae.AAC.1